MQRSRAFTLIELLVVIAIIAILAAILFPVFAQAKAAAKKAASLSQLKQTGTAIIMYAADVDDTGPTGTVPNLSNPAVQAWRPGDAASQNPAGWFNYPGAQDEYNLVWNNTIQPYVKNLDLLNAPGTNPVNITSAPWPTGYNTQLKKPGLSNFTYNGLLQSWSFTAIEAVSTLPLIYQGQGNISRNGAAMANPRLNCTTTGPCQFSTGGPPQSGLAANARGDIFNIFLSGPSCGTTGSYYVYGQGLLYCSADGSAKFVNPGRGNQASGNARMNTVFPIQFLEADGTVACANNFIRGRFEGSSLYVAAFCPDNNFSN